MLLEKTSSSTGGPSPILETQVRKVIYKDAKICLYGVLETDGRFFIHNHFTDPGKISNIKHYREVQAVLEENLASRGFDRYYTFADSENHFRYCEMMGFRTNLEVWDDIYEVMVKDL